MSERPASDAELHHLIAGRYVVEAILGRGGMAKVYRVRDERTGRPLALKRGWTRDSRKAEKRRALLEREFHTLAQLAHPRIIEVYDYGVDQDGPYYTMELLDGADLDQGGRLPWQDACALLCDVASSLAILHARGLVHRDVSLRNVRRTADGRAKLIDFGAMASMGVAKDIVGTPSFIAPEVMQLQALDACADLFSLGALGYFLLTGRHAYPARKFAELRDVWRSRPVPPERIVPELPPLLCALISQLLLLDRGARPQSAAEVMERLCGIAGLPMEERADVSRAYLATPLLVGRDKTLVAVRRRMLSLARGDGGTLLIEGAAGSGRSRLLDAAAFEGKLLGASVLRADAGDGSRGDWGVARALCTQLFELMPREAAETARLSLNVLSHVVEPLRGDVSVSAAMPERSLLLRELRDFIHNLTRGQRALIVIDDADRIDEPSLALLAALAHKGVKHSLMLVLAVDRDNIQTNPALHIVSGMADRIELEAFDAEQTLALIRSLFGDVANLHLCAGRIYELSHGSPRAAMELSQQLVSRGLARYAAGSWSLPAKLEEHDLPSTLSAALTARLAELPADARELAYALCLADGRALGLDEYRELCAFHDDRRMFSALDELMAARVLVADGERYRFSQQGFVPALAASISESQRALLHSRMADWLATSGGDVLRRAHHLFSAGRDHEAIDLLCTINLRVRLPPLPLLERALERAEHYGLPARTILALRLAILNKAPSVFALDSFRHHLPLALQALEQDSGLALFRQLSHLPPNERFAQALAITQTSYHETPEYLRGLSVTDALAELAKLSGACTSLASQSLDPQFLELAPELGPAAGLSPTIAISERFRAHAQDWLTGRRLHANQCATDILKRMDAPDHAGLDEMQHNRARLLLLYSLGLVQASLGSTRSEAYADMLEGDRDHRVSAWRLRLLTHLNQGNVAQARQCARRAELLQLHDGGEQRYLGISAGLELISYCQAGDLLGIKSALETVAMLAERAPGWQPVLSYGQCYQLWLRGDLDGALAALMPGLQRAQPARHPYFCMLAAAHIALLRALGRGSEALASGQSYVEICRGERLTPDDRFVYLEAAQALAGGGEHQQALRLIDSTISEGQALGMAGLSLGLLYEGRARIALCMHDRDAFARYAELCATEYRMGQNPVLSQKLARLLETARALEAGPHEATPQIKQLLDLPQQESEYETLHSRILECVDGSDRARCALTMLLQSVDGSGGYLYGVWSDRVEVLAALPESTAEDGLGHWVREHVQAELAAGATVSGSAEAEDDLAQPAIPNRYTTLDGRSFQPIMLIASHDQKQSVAAVLALEIASGPRSLPDRHLSWEIASQLLQHGDVGGAALEDASATVDER